MTNEELILERLERIETSMAPLTRSMESIRELQKDLTPLANNAFQLIIKELEDVESSFCLDDLILLVKRVLRSTRSFIYSLNQLESLVDFVTTLEPLLRSSVPQLINYLDELEQKGVFRMIMATLEVRAKVAKAYTPDDVDRIGDGLVALLGLTKKLSDPNTIAFLEKLAEIPAGLDLDTCKGVGPCGLVWASGNKEVKKGLGILIELAKGMGRLKPGD